MSGSDGHAVLGVQRIQVALHHTDAVGDQNNKTVEVDVLFEVTKKTPNRWLVKVNCKLLLAQLLFAQLLCCSSFLTLFCHLKLPLKGVPVRFAHIDCH